MRLKLPEYVRCSWLAWCVTLWWCLLAVVHLPQVSGIGCFVCSSVNGSAPECEDPFNNTGKFYQDVCFSGRKGRNGYFPGTECIKFKAQHDEFTVLVRDCTVDAGGISSDSEMGRQSHCGMLNKVSFKEIIMDGCSLACKTDGCNTSSTMKSFIDDVIIFGILTLLGVHGI